MVRHLTVERRDLDGFEGHLRIACAAILSQQVAAGHFYAREHLRAQALVRPIIDLPSALDAIDCRRSEVTAKEEG